MFRSFIVITVLLLFGLPSKAQKQIEINIGSQQLKLYNGDKLLKTYVISSATAGTGSLKNSNKTPLGRHKIAKKIGASTPLGGVLKGRKFTGEIADIYTDQTDLPEDYVTTRILWLTGLEPGVNKGGNVDSFSRYIYIHGTNEEGLLGKPASHGCIRMKNTDVIELYDLVTEGIMVTIKI